MICYWKQHRTGGVYCPQCGIVRKQTCVRACAKGTKGKTLHDSKRVLGECYYLLGPTEEDTAIKRKKGCRGNSRTSVWECDKHDRCTPYARPKDETIRACVDCGDYVREASETDSPSP